MKTKKLAKQIRDLNALGYSPATTGNYSVRKDDLTAWVSQSGIDKSKFKQKDFVLVDMEGKPLTEGVPSAETLLHLGVYQIYSNIRCVMHTHSVANTILSMNYLPANEIVFEGYEIQKAIGGGKTHLTQTTLPIFENSQDMLMLSIEMKKRLLLMPNPVFGFLLSGHGLYAFGTSIGEARRHVEAYEFLLKCLLHK